MKMNEPQAMREIHEIRKKHWEETKGMTHEQQMDYFRKKAEKLEAEPGLKLRRISNTYRS